MFVGGGVLDARGRIWNAPLLFFFYYVCYNVFT